MRRAHGRVRASAGAPWDVGSTRRVGSEWRVGGLRGSGWDACSEGTRWARAGRVLGGHAVGARGDLGGWWLELRRTTRGVGGGSRRAGKCLRAEDDLRGVGRESGER
jgi:hypothetical protein